VDKHDFGLTLEPAILKIADVKMDGRSWIAAQIEVRHSIAVQ